MFHVEQKANKINVPRGTLKRVTRETNNKGESL